MTANSQNLINTPREQKQYESFNIATTPMMSPKDNPNSMLDKIKEEQRSQNEKRAMTVKANVARLHKSNRKTPQALKYSYQAKDGKDGNKFKFSPAVQFRQVDSRYAGRNHALRLDPMNQTSQQTPSTKISGLARLKLNIINTNEPNSPISAMSPIGALHSTIQPTRG